jgi:murein L,D-transpeptidase YcbB/YkuD
MKTLITHVLGYILALSVYQTTWASGWILHPGTEAIRYEAENLHFFDAQGNKTQRLKEFERYVATQVKTHGLKTELYEIDQNQMQGWTPAQKNVVALDAFVRLAHDLSVGRTHPNQIADEAFGYADIHPNTPQSFQITQLLKEPTGSMMRSFEATFQPTHPTYQELRRILAETRKNIKTYDHFEVPYRKLLKKGVKDPSVVPFRKKMVQLGYLTEDNGSDEFGEALDQATRAFQRERSLVVDGLAGRTTFGILNMPPEDKVARVEANLERMRWLPKQLASKHLFVRTGISQLDMVRDGKIVDQMKVINGKALRRSPTMIDSIQYTILRPYWNIPTSIAVRDIVPKFAADSGYKDRMKIKAFKIGTETEKWVWSWSGYDRHNFNMWLRQEPGPDNALGLAKFMMENPFAIFLHDTNDKEKFQKANRNLSSGCIRLERWLDVAEFVMEEDRYWDRYSIFNFSMNEESKPETKVDLPHPTMVYILNITVKKNPDGRIVFTDDEYGQDYRIIETLNLRGTK